MDHRLFIVVPHFNHVEELTDFLPQLVKTQFPCLIVDDGSNTTQRSRLATLVDDYDDVTLIEHPVNQGKGAAVLSGASYAKQHGATHILQIDADGQHSAGDIQRFLDESLNQPNTMICGRPVFDESAPKARLYGRKVTTFWVVLETWSLSIKDGLCGFRIYPLSELEKVLDAEYLGKRMDFDTEVLVKAVWHDVPLKFIDTEVQYIQGGASHFHYLRDNLLLIRLHTRLMCGMVWRIPRLLAKLFAGKSDE